VTAAIIIPAVAAAIEAADHKLVCPHCGKPVILTTTYKARDPISGDWIELPVCRDGQGGKG
jgi:hypothetical protein